MMRSLGAWIALVLRQPSAIRFLVPWLMSLYTRDPLSTRVPWIVYPAQEWLRRTLTQNMQTFEWGCGGSTLYFADRVASHTAIEHERDWSLVVQAQLKREGLSHAQVLLKPATRADGTVVNHFSNPKQYQDLSFADYIGAIDAYPDDSFDIIVIDGRARRSCARHAFRKVRPGGSIILDNAERPEYEEIFTLYAPYTRQEFWGPGPYNWYFWKTTIFTRPM